MVDSQQPNTTGGKKGGLGGIAIVLVTVLLLAISLNGADFVVGMLDNASSASSSQSASQSASKTSTKSTKSTKTTKSTKSTETTSASSASSSTSQSTSASSASSSTSQSTSTSSASSSTSQSVSSSSASSTKPANDPYVIEFKKDEEKAHKEVLQALRNMETGFYVDIDNALSDWNIPVEVFWTYYHSYTKLETQDGKTIYRVDVEYPFSKQEVERMQVEIDKVTNEILSKIPAGASNWTKLLIVHDELVKRIEYDYAFSRDHRFDIYGALVEGQAVCAGYARAYCYVMEKAGVDVDYNSSTPYVEKGTDTHAWNSVTAGGIKYYIDVTWDDIDASDRFGNPYIKYDYFGLAQVELSRIEMHESGSIRDGSNHSNASYHVNKEYFLNSYDRDELARIFWEQYQAGSNVLTVKFASKEAYEATMEALCGAGWRSWENPDNMAVWAFIGEALPGYEDVASIDRNDDTYVFNIFLYP